MTPEIAKLSLFGKLKNMLTYLKKWWLLRQLSNECVRLNAERRGTTKILKEFFATHPNYYKDISDKLIIEELNKHQRENTEETYLHMDTFLDKHASNDWFWRKFDDPKTKMQKKKQRIETYRKILKNCQEKSEIELIVGKDYFMAPPEHENEAYIRDIGNTYEFSRIDSLIHELFFKDYRGWIATGVVFVGAVWGSPYLVTFKAWLIIITSPISPWW